MSRSFFVSIALLALGTATSPVTVAAESRSQISSRDCPYSCRTQGIPKEQCRDWQEGDRCFIEDLRGSSAGKDDYRARPREDIYDKRDMRRDEGKRDEYRDRDSRKDED